MNGQMEGDYQCFTYLLILSRSKYVYSESKTKFYIPRQKKFRLAVEAFLDFLFQKENFPWEIFHFKQRDISVLRHDSFDDIDEIISS